MQGTEKNKVGAIPPIRLNCHSAQHADCISQKAGKTAYVGLTINPVSCGAYLLAQSPTEQIYQIFDATGTTVVLNQGPFLVGTVNAWYNFGNIELFDLPDGEYTACAFIDQNGDGRWTANEPLSSAIVEPDSNEVLLDLWN